MRSLFIFLLGIALGLGGLAYLQGSSPSSPREILGRSALLPQEKQISALFSEVAPSVTFITGLALYRDLFSLNADAFPKGSGSGFIWDDEGHIVTNFHVIMETDALQVTLFDQSSHSAEVIGIAPSKDLAVLKIEAPQSALKPISLGRSSDLLVGQTVLAIGNPFGLDHSLTLGIVSALGRSIRSISGQGIEGVIQTDASINPGNSGGPLLDSAGRLIGINTAIKSPSGSSVGIGFAVPVDTINRVIPQLIKHGRLIRPRLGVKAADDSITRRLGLKGVLVLSVERGSPAARAGLKGSRRSRHRLLLGDLLTSLEGRELRSSDDLLLALEEHNPGEEVELRFQRQGQLLSLKLRLGAPRP